MTNCVISGNSTLGAAFIGSPTLVVEDSTINNNSGPGYLIEGSWVTLRNCIISDNSSGLDWVFSTLTMDNCQVTDNADGVYLSGGSISNSIISGNHAAGVTSGGTLTINNSTISGNT